MNPTDQLQGLSRAEVAERVAAGQTNATPDRTSRSLGDILRANLLTPFNALLLSLATVVIVIDGSPFNALFGIVIVINSGIGIVQELRAKRTLDRLAILSAPRAQVIRDGQTEDIAVADVVLGDLLHLGLGDQVVADGRVVESAELEIDESLLTGESDPIVKAVGQPVLSGSMVVAGQGYVEVTAVGVEAYQYSIASHAKRFKQAHSELLAATNRLLKWISLLLIVVAPLLIWGQLRIEDDWRAAVIHATAAIVGMIPEGLVLLTSMAFMLATMTLARRQVLLQQMPAVEGLARVDTLLLDKTGTLTEGKIRFDHLAEVATADQAMVESVLAAMANRMHSPTNDAIAAALEAVTPAAFDTEVPFSSARKWSALRCSDTTWVLGAPEVLLAHQTTSTFAKTAGQIASQGKRVLVLLSSSQPLTATAPLPADLRPRALVVLSERIRPDAAQTLAYFAEQGVDIKIISGDSPLTVAAVARSVGLTVDQPFDERNLPMPDADGSVTDSGLAEILQQHNVFGRVQPEQKRLIARTLQARGRVVAMTGDGVNDALALKDADIGIAMNAGAAATKAVAEIVLLDNRFGHLPNALGEGRRVIANIERVANLFLIKNVYSLVLALAVTVAGLPYPYLPSQMTVISALTIGIPAFFLALAPNARVYRPGFLGRVLRFAVPVGLIGAAMMMVNYALAHRHGVDQTAAGTSTSIIIIVLGLWVLICLSRPLKGWKIGLIVAMAAAFIGVISIPALSSRFQYMIDWSTIPTALALSAVGAILISLIFARATATQTT